MAIFLTLLAVFSTGCEFTFLNSSEPVTISGYVYFENEPLSDVKLRSDFYIYATTNAEGFYTFTTRSNILVFGAKKPGYNFTPKTYSSNETLPSYDFHGEKATALNGKLVLQEILFSPTSIVSIGGNNYSYPENNIPSLKLAEFVLKYNKEDPISLIYNQPDTQTLFAKKNEFTNILKNDPQLEIEILEGETNFKLQFMVKAFYKFTSYEEEIAEEIHSKVLNIATTLDTGDLNENQQVKFTASGINSTNNGFTYNIQFVFGYEKL